jgi:hypothetical protein
MTWLWLYSAVMLVLGLVFVLAPARVRSWLFPDARPTRNPFDTRYSLTVNRLVGLGFLAMSAIAGYAAWYSR